MDGRQAAGDCTTNRVSGEVAATPGALTAGHDLTLSGRQQSRWSRPARNKATAGHVHLTPSRLQRRHQVVTLSADCNP